jgi:hypothetical protein
MKEGRKKVQRKERKGHEGRKEGRKERGELGDGGLKEGRV